MIYISYSPETLKQMVKMMIFFYLVSFAFGGATLGVIYMVNTGKISIKDGVIYGKYTLKTIVIGVIVALLIIIVSFKLTKAKISKSDLFCNIVIKINNKKVKARAMVDTGNMLKEPISNIPVVVVTSEVLKDVVPKEILENIENILGGDLKNIPDDIKKEYMLKLKIIPFSSLGKQNGMLLGLKAQELEVEEENETKTIKQVIIGIYGKKLSKKDKYNALLGIDVI